MDQRWVHPFLCGREILNCNWIMREFIEDDFGIKKHGIFLRVRGSNQKFSAAEFVDQIDDGLLCRGIQSGEWFVHEDNFGRREECAEDGKTPLHSAGEFADRFFERICGEKAEK